MATTNDFGSIRSSAGKIARLPDALVVPTVRRPREVTVNHDRETMPNLFASAAATLLGDRYPQDSGAADVRALLDALDYAIEPRRAGSGSARHRGLLLRAASRFARVFQLAAPDAPGLVCFGAEFDPAIADPMHAGSPLVGVSGVGLSLQEAFQGCIGEGIEYLSQLQTASDVLFPADAAGLAAKPGPQAQAFLAAFAAHRIRPDGALSWYRARRLSDGSEVVLPADLCVRRPPDRREVTPPFPLSSGSAAGLSWDAAALHGVLELIERDAASLWWRGGQRAATIPAQHEASVTAEAVLAQLRRGASARRSWLLDITTDIEVPCVVSASCLPDGFGFALGLAARPTLQAAARSAVLEMCQLELALAVVDAKCRERGEAALNDRDRIHRRRATMINAHECELLQPGPARQRHLVGDTTDAGAALRLIVERLEESGIETFGLDLTRPRFEVPVARVVVPSLQLEPSDIITPRLADMIARTGGGKTYTRGVALI
jgi:ribosomal protein S12 methylthiotransferase accessory factor